MFNLFSSFDMLFFKMPFFNMIFLVFLFLKYWKNNFMIMLINSFYMILIKSFMPLKNKKFNKMMCIYIIMFMTFIFYMNFLGMVPYNIPMTSQASVVLMLSLMNWMMINMFFFVNLTKHFLLHHIPEGTPIKMIFFLFMIEVISNIIRPITLMLRLMGNIISGHIFLSLIFLIIKNISFMFFFIYTMYFIIEMMITFLQSYIMSTLIIMYYSDL